MYSTSTSDEWWQYELKFTLEDEIQQVYLALTDFTECGLYAAIVDSENNVVTSYPTKYQQVIDPISLPPGAYTLTLQSNTTSSQKNSYSSNLVRFSIDFLLIKENITDSDIKVTIEGAQVCNLPTFPQEWNAPPYLHPLSGYSLQKVEKYRGNEILATGAIKFTVTKPSMLAVALESPPGMSIYAELIKTKTTLKIKSTSGMLNRFDNNFLH